MSGVIDSLERTQLRNVPDFQAGDRVKVHFQVVEGNRRRTQVFEGTVLKRQGSGARETFTVRKQSFGVGVERTFPLHSPKIERIEVASRGDVRRAKLYYLRGRVGRRARVRERQFTGPADVAAGVMPPPEAPDEVLEAEALPEEPEAAEATEESAPAEAAEAPAAGPEAPAAEAEGEAPAEGTPEAEAGAEEQPAEAEASDEQEDSADREDASES
jgi:large subunit ribosomal protein L19